MHSNTEHLDVGMIVRAEVTLSIEHESIDVYRIGRVNEVSPETDRVLVIFEHHNVGEKPKHVQSEFTTDLVQRCRIFSQTWCYHRVLKKRIFVLDACEHQFVQGVWLNYFAKIDDSIQIVPEFDLLPPSHRQSPDPITQLKNYELRHPVWRTGRDHFVVTEAELRTLSFGIEDLIGSRVLLLAHQAEAIARVLSTDQPRFILADEVGLGKTIEACVILKAMRRRIPQFKTLIVVPRSLQEQWSYELDDKFWLHFSQLPKQSQRSDSPGLLISAEQLEDDEIWNVIQLEDWDMVIIDEAHHSHKRDLLYERLIQLSRLSPSVLILSATPIQRLSNELLKLLCLLDPDRYRKMALSDFQRVLDAQNILRQNVVTLSRRLVPDRFVHGDAIRRLRNIGAALPDDTVLQSLIDKAEQSQSSSDNGLKLVKEAIIYTSTNYRLQANMIRNRRVNLEIDMPQRNIEHEIAYIPSRAENDTYEAVLRYIDKLFTCHKKHPLSVEWARILLHATCSSPSVLDQMIAMRLRNLPITQEDFSQDHRLLQAQSPRQEHDRIRAIIGTLPAFTDETDDLKRIQWILQTWQEHQTSLLQQTTTAVHPSDRLLEVIKVVEQKLRQNKAAKILVFSTWVHTLTQIYEPLRRTFGSNAIAQFHAGIASDNLQQHADIFQLDERCQILLSDELGGEGRNFQIADLIVHVDLPWTPSVLEQRIGRVDRVGRQGKVSSCIVYAQHHIDHDLYDLWQDGLSIFSQSMSGMEIALEEIQDQVSEAFTADPQDGIRQLLPKVKKRMEVLREQVEEERYFEELSHNKQLHRQFVEINKAYGDGKTLRDAVLHWSRLAGLTAEMGDDDQIVSYRPRHINSRSLRKTSTFEAPDLSELLRHSRHARSFTIKGTFNRNIAVHREDLMFFALRSNPWIDAIATHAKTTAIGRCCGTLRHNSGIDWQGFDFLYIVQLDARLLFENNFDSVHLFRGQGYLQIASYRVVVSMDGEIMPYSHAAHQAILRPYNRKVDTHYGSREEGTLAELKDEYPPDMWTEIVQHAATVAEKHIQEEFQFSEEAEEASHEYEIQALGMRTAEHWIADLYQRQPDFAEIERYEKISEILVEAIHRPLLTLESVGYWILKS